MKKYLFVVALLLLSLVGSSQQVKFKTASFLNSQYLTCDDWNNTIPIGDGSHDVNNSELGGKYHPPTSLQLQSHDKRKTIARSFLMIEVDLINMKDESLVLEQVNLQIKSRYKKPVEAIGLDWEIGSRGSGYNPYFEIDGSQTRYTHLPDEFLLNPKGEPQDSRITLEVECYEPDAIWHFEFTLVFIDPSNPGEKINVKSDMSYFIASE